MRSALNELAARVALPHAVGFIETETRKVSRSAERDTDLAATLLALKDLFADRGFPNEADAGDLIWLRDFRGKPSVAWHGAIARWAAERDLDHRYLHVSNTHDGSAHLVLSVYAPKIVGVGIDVVHLPRLRRPGKDSAYLRRFAAQFMSEAEQDAFTEASHHEDEEPLRIRVAAHFSLMEAASKAFGTGLRLGIGRIRHTALPPRSLGVVKLEPETVFALGEEAKERRKELGGGTCEGHWAVCSEYLVSLVVLWREGANV
jgi:phosphopantetheine--protein transferase-like protein